MVNQHRSKRIIITLFVFIFMIGSVVTASAADTPATTGSASLGKVPITAKSYFELTDVQLVASDHGKTLFYKVIVHNNDTKDINLIDYWFRVRSTGGATYSVNLAPADKNKDKVPAQSTEVITLYADVSSNLNYSNLRFEFITWDFSTSTYERTLGTLSLPASYTPVAPVNTKKSVLVSGTELVFGISHFAVSQTEKNSRPIVSLEIENTGKRSMKISGYQFQIVTSDGIMYPLTSKDATEVVINPRMSEKFSLSGVLPASVIMKGAYLLVSQAADGLSSNLPIASLLLPESTVETGGVIGEDYSFSTEDGDYHVQLKSIARYPLEDQDILSATIVLTNSSSTTAKIPDLIGTFVLDGAVDIAATAFRSDKVIGLKPNTSLTIQLYGLIPYTYDFNEIKLTLQSRQSGDEIIDLLDFDHNSDLTTIPVVKSDEEYQLDLVGNRSVFKIRNVDTYTSLTSKIFSVQLDVTNLEKRLANLVDLTAHFETADGAIYPANISEITDRMSPGGKASLQLWKELPANIDTSTIRIVIGQQIQAGGDNAASAIYINPIAFDLPAEQTEALASFDNLDFYPYALSLSNFKSQLIYLTGEIKIDFDYTLSKDLLVLANTKDHKVILEITDDQHGVTKSQVYALEGENGSLSLGTNKGVFSQTDPNLIFDINTLSTYTMNVYHQFQEGQKKLIASKDLQWFVTSN